MRPATQIAICCLANLWLVGCASGGADNYQRRIIRPPLAAEQEQSAEEVAEEAIEESHQHVNELEEPPPSSTVEETPEPDPALLEVEPGSLPTWSEEKIADQREMVASALEEYQQFAYRFREDDKTTITGLLEQDGTLHAELMARGFEDTPDLWSATTMKPLMYAKLMEGGMIRPVDGPVTSNFGNRFHPIHREYRLHAGTDFGEPSGEPVRAAGSGRIIYAGVRGGYGNFAEIDHGGGSTTRYAHLSRIRVTVGELVAQAHIIGNVGSSGQSTGPHLHWEFRRDGAASNPLNQVGK